MREPRKLIIPNKQWAKAFLELREDSDESALQYLCDQMENAFSHDERLDYIGIRGLVYSLVSLNRTMIEMEIGEIEYDSTIEECYRNLMSKLSEIAEYSMSFVNENSNIV